MGRLPAGEPVHLYPTCEQVAARNDSCFEQHAGTVAVLDAVTSDSKSAYSHQLDRLVAERICLKHEVPLLIKRNLPKQRLHNGSRVWAQNPTSGAYRAPSLVDASDSMGCYFCVGLCLS